MCFASIPSLPHIHAPTHTAPHPTHPFYVDPRRRSHDIVLAGFVFALPHLVCVWVRAHGMTKLLFYISIMWHRQPRVAVQESGAVPLAMPRNRCVLKACGEVLLEQISSEHNGMVVVKAFRAVVDGSANICAARLTDAIPDWLMICEPC